MEAIIGPDVIRHDGSKVSTADFTQEGTIVGIYFSAHWCPPCRGFTPQLAEFYKKLKSEGKKFEVVFVSSDRDDQSFKDYFQSMPWLAIDFQNKGKIQELKQKYGISGIPTLIILDGATGAMITKDGRGKVTTSANAFPWK